MTSDTKTGVPCTEKGVWGRVGKKIKVSKSTPLKDLRYVVGRTETMLQVPNNDTKSATVPSED